jgi:hypothetical protein
VASTETGGRRDPLSSLSEADARRIAVWAQLLDGSATVGEGRWRGRGSQPTAVPSPPTIVGS